LKLVTHVELVKNPLSFVKSDVLVGNAALVINHESLVKSEVFVGKAELVINQLSLVKSLVFVGTSALVIYQLSFVKFITLPSGSHDHVPLPAGAKNVSLTKSYIHNTQSSSLCAGIKCATSVQSSLYHST
jgi:hypothetical protein